MLPTCLSLRILFCVGKLMLLALYKGEYKNIEERYIMLITSTDLANWAPSRDCQENLPLLVRKLIRASDVEVQNMLMPAGDNVIHPGYDGILEVSKGDEYIPFGKSVWEMGSGKDFKAKANDDIAKRSSSEPAGQSNVVFVFVTPYVWSGKERWIKEQENKGYWKSVSVIDGQILEEWLEKVPAVSAWLSKHLHLSSGKIQSLDNWWGEWSSNLKYRISPTLVLSGRVEFSQRLLDFFTSPPAVLIIKASTTEEVMAFCAGAILNQEENVKEKWLAKAVLVGTEEDFRILMAIKSRLLLIPRFEIEGLADHAVKNGHHVIVPVARSVTAAQKGMELPRIKRKDFEKGLEDMGFDLEKVHQLTRDSGLSLAVLRRILEFSKRNQPLWGTTAHYRDLIPALLLGAWDEQASSDRLVVSFLAGMPYDEYILKLTRWKVEEDAPVFQVKSIWRLTSVSDTWSILAPYLNKLDVARFETVVLASLRNEVVRLQVIASEIAKAVQSCKSDRFSYFVKQGLCQSLIMMGVFGEEYNLPSVSVPQNFVDRIVRQLLDQADGNQWEQLHRFLPLIAEASPGSFLSILSTSLDANSDAILKMFGIPGEAAGYSTSYTNLLSALEALLVSPDYILQSTMLLVRLVRLDPGVTFRNSPMNSLLDTYTPWYRQTEADLALRMTIVGKIIKQDAEVAWRLLLKLLPEQHRTVCPIYQCMWRFEAYLLDRQVQDEFAWDFYRFIFDRLIGMAGIDEEKVAVLTEHVSNICFEDRVKFQHYLEMNIARFTSGKVWNALRKLLSWHRRCSEETWALPETELIGFEKLLKLCKPTNSIVANKFVLEEWHPDFPEGVKYDSMNSEDVKKFCRQRREIAFMQVYREMGMIGIKTLITQLTDTKLASETAVTLSMSELKAIHFFLLLKEPNPQLQKFAQVYIYLRATLEPVWAQHALSVIEVHWKEERLVADFFLWLPETFGTWELLNSVSKGVVNIYWQKMSPGFCPGRKLENEFIINQLYRKGRYTLLIDKIPFIAEELTCQCIIEVLAAADIADVENKLDKYSNDVARIFKVLYERENVEEGVLIDLEWKYLSYLCRRDALTRPIHLLKKLTADSCFFAEVAGQAHASDNKEEMSYNEEAILQWIYQSKRARELLNVWRDVPGKKADGTFDGKRLVMWINSARIRGVELKKTYAIDSAIGTMLAHDRREIDWPCDDVCEIMEEINSDVLFSHFKTEIVNGRGVYSKLPFYGGGQERAIATYFKNIGKRKNSKFPVVASVFFDLAARYEVQARDEDETAHLDEFRW